MSDSPSSPSQLKRSLTSRRSLINSTMNVFTVLIATIALVPLISVLYSLVDRGSNQLKAPLLVHSPISISDEERDELAKSLPIPEEIKDSPRRVQAKRREQARAFGRAVFGHAIVGTLLMVGIATVISVPIGILTALFLSEIGRGSKWANAVRFSAQVLTGLPSIIAGVFIYVLVVRPMGGDSALAGGIALSLLMLPTVILTAEAAFSAVPEKMKEAAFGMGATQTQVILKVVLPTAIPGVLTGVMLGIARVAGETAPLLFVTTLTQDFSYALNEPSSALSLYVYDNYNQPEEFFQEMLWTASFVLVSMILVINLTAQFLTRSKLKK